jgi:hypothetical protein
MSTAAIVLIQATRAINAKTGINFIIPAFLRDAIIWIGLRGSLTQIKKVTTLQDAKGKALYLMLPEPNRFLSQQHRPPLR